MLRATASRKEGPSARVSPTAGLPGRLNLCLAVLQISAAIAIFYGLARCEAGWQIALLIAGFVIVGNAIYFMLHEAEHRTLHPVKSVNDLAGTVLAMLFPAPFTLLRQVHLAHHHANRTPDEAFDLYLPDDPRWWKYVQFYGLLTGAFYLVSVLGGPVLSVTPRRLLRNAARCDRQTSAVVRLLNDRAIRWIRMETACVIALQAGIVWAMGDAWPLYLLAYLAFGVSWSTMQYLHHYGTPIDRREGAVDLRPLPVLSWVWLHHHHHLTHHRHPRVPWTQLPAWARRDRVALGSMWRQYVRQWRGPRLFPEDAAAQSASLEASTGAARPSTVSKEPT